MEMVRALTITIMFVTTVACGEGGGGVEGSVGVDSGGGDAPPAADAGPASTTWITFLGGTAFEQARDVTVDVDGNVIVVGGTQSMDFPTTAGAYDRTYDDRGGMLGTGGTMDVFVTKFAPDGKMLWSTFVGGPNYDRAYAVETDAAGDIYVAGRAGADFPTTAGVVQPGFAGDVAPNTLYGPQDGFVFKLSADGSTLIWSTYFGSDGSDIVRDMDVDPAGNVYLGVSGITRPLSHITANALQAAPGGGVDTVLAKLSPDATRVIWATYFGGSADEGVPSIRVDDRGAVYLATDTLSTDLPVTAGAYQMANAGGRDFFVAKVMADGTSLAYCTYFGGSGHESAETHHLAVDSTGRAIIATETTSTDLPTTAGAVQRTRNGPGDGFVAILSVDGSALAAATYVGGSGYDGIQGVAVDAAGNIYIGGTTPSNDLGATSGAYQRTYRGMGDGWAAWLGPQLGTIRYLTYLGARRNDAQRSLWIDGAGNIVTTGQSASPAFPTTGGAFQRTFQGGNADAYVGRIVIH